MAYTINWDMVSALARNKHVPKLKDNFFLSNALFYRWKSRVRDWTGGPTIVVPLSFAPEGGGGSWYSGTDKFDTSVRNPIKAAQYFPKNAQVTVAIDSDEELAVTGPEAVLNLVAQKMRIAERTAVDLIGTNLYNDGSNPKAITGLQYALKSDVASVARSYGGILAGGTTVALDPNGWWQHNADTTAYSCGTSGGTFFMQQTDNAVSKMWGKIALRSGEQPTIILSNWGSWTDFHNSMAKNERYDRPQQQTDLAKAGFRNLMYRSAPWVADERAPRGGSLGTDVEIVYLIDEESLGLWVHPRRNMEMEDWRKPIDQDARVAYIFWRGELCFDERRSSGVISAVTTTNVLAG